MRGRRCRDVASGCVRYVNNGGSPASHVAPDAGRPCPEGRGPLVADRRQFIRLVDDQPVLDAGQRHRQRPNEHVKGDCSTPGNCTDNQTTTVDAQTTTNTASGQNVNTTTNCTGSTCTATPPPPPTIDSGPTQPSTTSTDATFKFRDADTSATFLCSLDAGGYLPCASGQTYNALDPGSHTFQVEAKNPNNGAVSDPASYTWTISSNNANVLIAGTGDEGSTEPNDNLAGALTSAGYTVTESSSLPSDLSSFGQVWWVDTNPPTSAEQTQLINFAKGGGGVFLTGEWFDGTSGFGDLDGADQSMVNSMLASGSVTVGGDPCDCTMAMPVNASVVGNAATQPNTVTAVWDRPSVLGEGRLALFMDINWPESSYRDTNWFQVAENIAFFLSGLSSPPSPPVLQAAINGPSVYGARQMTPARPASTIASGRENSTG